MDCRKFCIIDIGKETEQDLTGRIKIIEKDFSKSEYNIVFSDNKNYSYGFDRIIFLDNPSPVEIENQLVFVKGELKTDVKEILDFKQRYKVIYSNGQQQAIRINELQIVKDGKGTKNTIDYLIEVANLEKAANQKKQKGSSPDDFSFMVSQLERIHVKYDSVLNTYLNKKFPMFYKDNDVIIAPFSANGSQLDAIKKALNSSISIIQGPPGTGKTQTILNIVANLLIRNKTIAVVSGNNEATNNVYEKLQKEKLESLCACLGNKANMKSFFATPHTKDSLKSYLKDFPEKPKHMEIKNLEEKAFLIYKKIQELAQTKAEIEELKIEGKISIQANREDRFEIPRTIRNKKGSRKCLAIAACLESIYATESKDLFHRISTLLKIGFLPPKNFDSTIVIDYLQNRFYTERIKELELQLVNIEKTLSDLKKEEILKNFKEQSIVYLLATLNEKYKSFQNIQYTKSDLRNKKEFLFSFPIILSTTHSLQNSAPKEFLFDYVIIDESSQVNLTSAVIALSVAKNVVIIGDQKQLSHIVPNQLKEPLDSLRSKYELPDFIDYKKYNILESILLKFKDDVPYTLLSEHYRCDPEIINFCNKRFYDNKLIIQTEHKTENGITIIETPSHTAYGRTNKRQAEIIKKEILPIEKNLEEVGVVAPYRDQVNLIQSTLEKCRVFVNTVHQFQGKERNTMILSTTADRTIQYEDPEHIDFLNHKELINVAISRAKEKIYIIATKEALNQENTLLNDIYKYTNYYSTTVKKVQTKVYSVFDLMYDAYSPILENMKNNLLKISKYESENIIATIIKNICESGKFGALDFKFNYPLRKIVNTEFLTNTEDKNFLLNPSTHCDFVIYNTLDKAIQLIIEVDGKQHDKELQKKRDIRKDRILREANLNLLRIKTTDINIEETIQNYLLAKHCDRTHYRNAKTNFI